MFFILRKVWSWKRIEAFPGLGIALSLVTVLIYQVYVYDLFKRKINESPTSSTNQQFAVWQCCCKEDDGKHICDGLLEGGLSRSSGLKKKTQQCCFALFFAHFRLREGENFNRILISTSESISPRSMCRPLSTMDKILSRATSFHFWRSGVDFIFCLHNALLVPSHLVHDALLAKPL